MTWYDDAVRTIIELPAAHLEALARVCRRDGISRAEAIRRLLEAQLAKETADGAGQAFGLWRGRDLDGLAYQEQMRREWSIRARRR